MNLFEQYNIECTCGNCSGKPQHHKDRDCPKRIALRFLKHTVIYHLLEDPNACWEWKGCRKPYIHKKSAARTGYGLFVLEKGKSAINASRAAHAIFIGNPGTQDVLHNCDNPACVNPKHLHLGNAKMNAEERVARGHQGGGGSVGWRKYGPKTIKQVLKFYKKGIQGNSILAAAKKFKVSVGTTWLICTNKYMPCAVV